MTPNDAVRVAILGAGPAGLGAALGLARRGFDVHVFEAADAVGGLAASHELAGVHVDYGSHRLHPASDPAVLDEIRSLLGDDLLERPRHGRIRLLGRWIHFPLRAPDLALRMHPKFSLGVGIDLLKKVLPRRTGGHETFASVLRAGLGRTICEEFYFPYARKLWGLGPEELSATQARKRVSSGSIGKMLRRLVPQGSGAGSKSTKGIFYYPKRGFGQIAEAYRQAAEEASAQMVLGQRVSAVERLESGRLVVRAEASGGATVAQEFDHVWSTIPVHVLAQLVRPALPPDVLEAASAVRLRSMLLIYLVLETGQFTEYDAHYFPAADIRITRLSEPKNYSDTRAPHDATVLCAELPCFVEDDVWSMEAEELGEIVLRDLRTAGLEVQCGVRDVQVRRHPAAYPVYVEGYEKNTHHVDAAVGEVPRLLTFGRQGLFAHDNTHHALFMARAAVDCLADDGTFDAEAWARWREVFEAHVVED